MHSAESDPFEKKEQGRNVNSERRKPDIISPYQVDHCGRVWGKREEKEELPFARITMMERFGISRKMGRH